MFGIVGFVLFSLLWGRQEDFCVPFSNLLSIVGWGPPACSAWKLFHTVRSRGPDVVEYRWCLVLVRLLLTRERPKFRCLSWSIRILPLASVQRTLLLCPGPLL